MLSELDIDNAYPHACRAHRKHDLKTEGPLNYCPYCMLALYDKIFKEFIRTEITKSTLIMDMERKIASLYKHKVERKWK